MDAMKGKERSYGNVTRGSRPVTRGEEASDRRTAIGEMRGGRFRHGDTERTEIWKRKKSWRIRRRTKNCGGHGVHRGSERGRRCGWHEAMRTGGGVCPDLEEHRRFAAQHRQECVCHALPPSPRLRRAYPHVVGLRRLLLRRWLALVGVRLSLAARRTSDT